MMYTVYFSASEKPDTARNWHAFDATHWKEQTISGSMWVLPAAEKY